MNIRSFDLPPSEPVEVLVSEHQPDDARFKHYVIGFIGSLVLTLCAYLLTYYHVAGRNLLFFLLAGLALTQFTVQLFFFLHVGKEFSPKYKLMMTGFMLLVVIILVGGSLWMMFNLNSRVMPSTKQMERYMNSQSNL